MGLFDLAIDIGSKVNHRIYCDYYGSTKNRHILDNKIEVIS